MKVGIIGPGRQGWRRAKAIKEVCQFLNERGFKTKVFNKGIVATI